MKVLDFNLRTPGIFLQEKDKTIGGSEIKLSLEIWQETEDPEESDYTSESGWKNINEDENIKVLADVPEPEDLKQGELRTQELKVPYQNTGTVTYKLLVPDNKTWFYRIVAVPCIECYKLYEDMRIDSETLKVLVGKGSFKS